MAEVVVVVVDAVVVGVVGADVGACHEATYLATDDAVEDNRQQVHQGDEQVEDPASEMSTVRCGQMESLPQLGWTDSCRLNESSVEESYSIY